MLWRQAKAARRDRVHTSGLCANGARICLVGCFVKLGARTGTTSVFLLDLFPSFVVASRQNMSNVRTPRVSKATKSSAD
jgi:hypothetical protein